MKFLNTSKTLVLAWIVAVSLLFLVLPGSSKRYDPDPRDPSHTCVYACMPGGSHGCRDNCPVCDPVLRRCVAEGGGEGGSTTLRVTLTPPPTAAPPPPPSVAPPPPPPTSKPPPPPPSTLPPPPPTEAPPPTGTGTPSGGTSTAPPSGTKCTGRIKNLKGATDMWDRPRADIFSRWLGETPHMKKLELTEKVNGQDIGGNPRWFKFSGALISGKWHEYSGAWISGRDLRLDNKGDPAWCTN